MKTVYEQTAESWYTSNKVKQLAALIPEYLEGKGDVTRCVFRGSRRGEPSEILYEMRPIDAVAEKLRLSFGYSHKGISEMLSKHLGRRRKFHLPLNEHLVLTPFKARQAKVERDRVTGYFMLGLLKEIVSDASERTSCKIVLKSGEQLDCFQSEKSLRVLVSHAYHVKLQISERNQLGSERPSGRYLIVEEGPVYPRYSPWEDMEE